MSRSENKKHFIFEKQIYWVKTEKSYRYFKDQQNAGKVGPSQEIDELN